MYRNTDLLFMLLPGLARAVNNEDCSISSIEVDPGPPNALRFSGTIAGTSGVRVRFTNKFVCCFSKPEENPARRGEVITRYTVTVKIAFDSIEGSTEESYSGYFYPVPGSGLCFTLNQPQDIQPVE